MSTNLRPTSYVPYAAIFDGRLSKYGVNKHVNSEGSIMLTDGRNYLAIFEDKRWGASFTRYFPNGAPGKILDAICDAFNTDIVSEHDPEYYGFKSQEEWDAAWEKMARADREEFARKLGEFARGERSTIEGAAAGSVAEEQANIAKRLADAGSELIQPGREMDLLEEIERIDPQNPEKIKVRLTQEDLELAKMLSSPGTVGQAQIARRLAEERGQS